jgi:[ribosomal protein S5]-alanine N-acetyltransferase
MALLTTSRIDDQRVLVSGRVSLRPPLLADYEAWSTLREDSRSFLTPWEPTWPPDDLSRAAYRRRLRRYSRDVREDIARPFFVFRARDGVLIGSCILSNIRRGVAQAGTLGYWTGKPFAAQGYMTEALRAVVGFAFDDLGLHRLEAACLPTNVPSQRLLRRAGFTEEGFARAYLKINGRWEDHLLFAMVASDPRPA